MKNLVMYCVLSVIAVNTAMAQDIKVEYATEIDSLSIPSGIYDGWNDNLDAVTVSAQRIIEKKDGMFSLVPSAQDITSSGRGIDVLLKQPLPGLRVNPALQTITVDGGTPILQINGREVNITRFANISPDKIKKIEYSNNPGARYLDRGATGVINIVLKESEDGGSVNIGGESALTTGFVNSYDMGSYHKGKSEFALEYNYNHRSYDDCPNIDTDKYISPERTVERSMKFNNPFHYNQHSIGLEYTFQPNDSTMLVASLNANIMDGKRYGGGTMSIIDNGVKSDVTRKVISPYKTNQDKLDIYFTHKMADNQKIEFNVVGILASGFSAQTLEYSTPEGSKIFPTNIYNNGWSLTAEGVYNKQFGKVGTRFGLQYQHNSANNKYIENDVLSSMSKDNAYAFAQVDGPIGEKATWTLGTGVKLFAVKDGTDHKNYVRNLSIARFNWKICDVLSLQATGEFSPSLPSLSDLSPVFVRTDDVEAQQGNPNLTPANNLNGRLLLRFAARNGFYANANVSYSHTFDPIITSYSYNSEKNLFVASPANASKASSFNTGMEIGVKDLFGHFNVNYEFIWSHNQSIGDTFNHQHYNFYNGIDFSAVWEHFTAGCSFTITPYWSLWGETIGRSEDSKCIYAQYRWKDLTFSATWFCPFSPNGWAYETKSLSEVHPLEHVNYTANNGNMVVLGIRWNMNFGKSFRKSDRTLWNGGYDNGMVQ